MSPDKQQITIAEACGWTHIAKDYPINPDDGDFYIMWPSGIVPGTQELRKTLPDYLNDLNAMHEAEKVLDEKQRWDYQHNLSALSFPMVMATASQRAEAFLRTIGKWEDEP